MQEDSARPALSARHVAKSFVRQDGKSVTAVVDLSLNVSEGSATALVGPDGSGKTTFLRMAAGLLSLDDGSVDVLGYDVSSQAAAIQAEVGYMPQRFGLYEDLSVIENLDLYAEIKGVESSQRQHIYERLMRITALGPFQARRAGLLSGGMKQKLGLACALVGSPRLLLLDEPTVGIDPFSRRELWEIIFRLVAVDGLSVLLSTSHLDEAARCEHVVVLKSGCSIFAGPPGEVAEKARERAFIAQPAPGVSARALQSRLFDRPGIVDAVPSAGQVRYVTALPYAEVPSVEPSFEDGFMLLFRAARLDSELPVQVPDLPTPLAGARSEAREIIVEVSDLVRKFGSYTAVNDISFAVNKGQVFGLLGPNGAGKTTTFRMLCGLLPATSGQLRVAGTDLRSSRASARRHIGYMAQKFSLYGPLTIRENLDFFARAYGLDRSQRRRRIDWAIDEFGLSGYLSQPAAELPGGIRQRLSLAAALLHEPRILFLDEPTSGADPVARREFWLRINELAESGVTIVVTTHFMEEAEYCDQIVILDRGKVVAAGTPAAIRSSAAAAAGPKPGMEEAFVSIVSARRGEDEDEASALVETTETLRAEHAKAETPDQRRYGQTEAPTYLVSVREFALKQLERVKRIAKIKQIKQIERVKAHATPKAARILALIHKEMIQLIRDPSTITIGIVMPLMLVLLFGYGLSLDVKNVPVALVLEDSSSEAQDLAARFELSPYFDTRRATTMQVAEQLMLAHEIRAILHLASDFSRNLAIGQPTQVQLLVNGADANTARIIESYARSTLVDLGSIRGAEDVATIKLPVELERRLWFNAANESRHFLVPGLIVLVMTLLGAFMTALVMAREWERGTFEALFVTPVEASEILVGKLVPYFLLGLVGLALSVAGSKLLFGVPFRGSWAILVLVSSLYLVVALSIGLVASALTRSQFVASQIALIVTFLPAVMLSGFLFDLNSMPAAVRAVTYLLPARYYVALLQTLFLAGNVWQVIVINTAVLLGMAVLMLAAASALTKKSLD
jgi:ABC-type multidrug transport system ATPase subunit/ABC-type multidrug transport system permease subunit